MFGRASWTSRVQEGIRLGQGVRDKDWRTMKREAPSHWMVGPLRWKVAAAVVVAVAAATPAAAEDIAAVVER